MTKEIRVLSKEGTNKLIGGLNRQIRRLKRQNVILTIGSFTLGVVVSALFTSC